MRDRRDFILGAATAMGAVAVFSADDAGAVALAPSVSFNVLYPNHAGAWFDMAYYKATHIPLVERVMKPARTLLIEGVAADANPAPYAMIAHFEFPTAEVLQAALARPDMGLLRDDLVNFTDIKPAIMMGKSG